MVALSSFMLVRLSQGVAAAAPRSIRAILPSIVDLLAGRSMGAPVSRCNRILSGSMPAAQPTGGPTSLRFLRNAL
jgi:hypothetical protein